VPLSHNMRIPVSACSQNVQGGDTTSEDDEGYVTDPEPEPPTSAALGGTDSAIPDVLPNAAAGGGADGEPTPESVEEFRQRLARKESGADASTSGRPGTAFGLEARHRSHFDDTLQHDDDCFPAVADFRH